MEGLPVRVTTFEPTETMSTYLLAFIVTDFIEVESKKHNLLVRYSSFLSIWRKFNWLIDNNH